MDVSQAKADLDGMGDSMSWADAVRIYNAAKVLINPATDEKLDAILTELELKAGLADTQPISADSLPLPVGASTAANQTNGEQLVKITDGTNAANVGTNGGLDVNIQDQTTDPIILPFVQQLGTTTLSANTVVGNYTMQVTSATGFIVGQHIRIINSLADRFFFGTILTIAGTTITVDTPIDSIYLSASEVTISNINMAVNGAVTPVIFKLRTGTPSIPSAVDITRLIMVAECSGAVSLAKFGDLTALTRGLVFRQDSNGKHNIFNVKRNSDLAGIAFDFVPYLASNPSQGTNGFAWRLTFSGQEKLGVVLRVPQDGNLEFVIQDNLTGITSLKVIAEGHVVNDN